MNIVINMVYVKVLNMCSLNGSLKKQSKGIITIQFPFYIISVSQYQYELGTSDAAVYFNDCTLKLPMQVIILISTDLTT